MVGARYHQGRTVSGECPQIAWLSEIEGGIVQPEQPAPRAADKPDDPVAAVADVEVASMRQVARQRRPAHSLVHNCGAAAIVRLDPMATCRQRLGKCDKGRLGAAEWCGFRHQPVEGDAVIGHHDVGHHSNS